MVVKTGMKSLLLCLILSLGIQIEAKSADTEIDDFRLSNNVKCLELRSYDLDAQGKCMDRDRRWTSHLLWCREPLSRMNPEIVKRFRKVKPKFRKKSNIGGSKSGMCVNAFTIDKNDRVWRMDEIKDVLLQLGEIDTPAEAQLVLWMHGYPEGNRHRKTAKGYAIDIKSMEWGEQKSATGAGGIAEFCSEGRNIIKRALVDGKGRIVSYRTIFRSKKVEQGCIHAEPEPIYPEER